MTQQEQAFLQAYTTLSKRNDLYAQQKRAYQNLNQNDFDSAYNAALLKQSPIRANTQKYGIAADLANWGYDNLVANNSFGAGVADTTATWLGGGARFLGDTFNSQALKDLADRADALKRYHRVYHDMYNGDSTLSNLAYGAGTIAPELPIGGPAIKIGTGILSNALKSAGFGGLMGGITSLADSDQSLGQAGMSAVYGGVGGGLLGAVGSSVMGKLNGYGWSNSGGLLDRAKGTTNSGGLLDRARIKPDPITGTANAGDDAIARAMKAQMNPHTAADLGISEPKFYVPNGLKDPTLAAIDNDLAQELMQKLNDLKLRGQLTEQTTDALLKEAFAKGERVAQPQMSVKAPKNQSAVQQIPAHEEAQLRKEFAFKDNKPLQRELTHSAIAHALKQHGNPEIESSRGQIAITLDDIKTYYPAITQNYDYRAPTNNNAIVYAKQINGHFITIEEVIQNGKLRFKTAWKTKGNFNQQQVFRNAQYVENRSQIGNPRPADITATQAEYSSKATPETLADNVNLTTPNINAGLDDTQYSMQMSSSLRGEAEAINNQGSPNSLADEHGRLPRSARNDIGGARNDAIDPNFAPQSSLRGREDEAINNVGSPTREIAAPALTHYQQQLLQSRLAEFNHSIRGDDVNPQQIDVTDIESLTTFFNGWRDVRDPITAKDLLDTEILKEMGYETLNKDYLKLFKDLESITLSVDPRIDKDGMWKALKKGEIDFKTDRNYATKSLGLDKKKDPKMYREKQERARELLRQHRARIENELHINPIKEFGTNYAEFYHDGVGAIRKLMAEAKDYQARKIAKELTQEEQARGYFSGQVAGAFYREDLQRLSGNGNIDLVWGEVTDAAKHKGYGLAHIRDKHPELDVNLIPEIVEKGSISKTHNGFNIEYDGFKVGLNVGWNDKGVKQGKNQWVVTAYEKNADSSNSPHFTEGEIQPSNSNTIIPQNPNQQYSFKNPMQERANVGTNMMSRLAHQAASNAVAGTAGGVVNVALDDSDDALALKFAKGFAYGVMGKVAAKHGMPAATKAGKAAFDYAMKQTTELRTLWRENPQLWTRFLNKQLTDDFAQFGGQKAGLHAERFAVAETLAAKGVGETEILERTGWFKGLDGHWKFQIDLSNGAAYKLKEGTYSLSQLFKQPSLYQAYPFLKKMRVSIQTMPENVNGYFDMPTLTIHLNSANNKFDFTQALSHEVQHIIQQYEGFAVGTSKKDPNYWTNAGEVEARATFKGGENNPQQRLNNELEEGRLIQEFEKQAPQSSLRTSNASAAINNQDSPNGLGQTESAIAAPAMQARNDAMGANNVAHSQKLEDSYLNKATQRIDTEALNKHAIPLPKPLSQHEFMAQAQTDAQGIARVQTPIGEVNVHLEGAWRHINKGNTYGKDRTMYSGAFYSTLTDPLFVVKQKHTMHRSAHSAPNAQKVQQSGARIGFGESITQDSYVFFKPYIDSNGAKYLAGFAIDKNGQLVHKTFFDPSITKIQRWIQSHNDDLLYYKFDPQSSLRGETEAINNANSPNGLGNETLVQQIQTKFKFDEAKARDLAQWHKDSHPVTKEKDGTPKVFYHGSGDDFGFEVFKPSAADEVEAIYFSTSEKVAKSYEQMGYRNSGIYKCFLNIKNPLVLDFKKEGYNSEKYTKALHQAKANGNDGVIIKNVYDDTGGYYDSKGDFKDIPSAHTYIIFDSKQIKEINNRGIEGKYFNESSPNIYESVRKPTTDNQHHNQKLDISGLTINLREMSAEQKKAFVAQLDLRANAEHVPAKMSEEEFRNSAVKYAKNKPNFLAHIKSRSDAEARMKLLNLVEPTIEHFHYKVVNGDVERFIKTFSYEGGKNDVFSLVVTKNNKTQLTTFLPTSNERYIKHIIEEGEIIVGGQRIASLTEGSKALSAKQGKTTDSQGISSDLLPDDTQYSLKNPLKDLRNAAARIEGIKAFAKYLANPPEHLKADAQRLRNDKAAMAELDMHTRKAATDKANAIDELAYQMGYPEPQYSMKNPRQKEKFKEDSVGLVEQIRSSSKAFADKILHSKWVDVPLGTRIYTKGFEDYRGIKDSFDRDIAANTSNALDLHNKLKLLSEDNQRKMYQYMSGDLKGEELSKDIRELADEFRKVVRKETDELVKLGLLNEETAKKWGDIYIMREYSPRVTERIKRVLNGGRSEDYGIGLDSIHMRGKKEKVSVEKYNEMLEKGEIGDITKGKWEVLHKPTKHEPKYILRRDYTKSEREKMGEIELISTALPRTLAKLQNQKRIATFFDALSKNSDLAFKLEKNQEIPSGFRQLRGEQFGAVRVLAVLRDFVRSRGKQQSM